MFQAVIASIVSGLPILIPQYLLSLATLIVAVGIYKRTTPLAEWTLMQQGNISAGIALSGSLLGLAIPLAVCLAGSVHAWDIILWGAVVVILELLTFGLMDILLRWRLKQFLENDNRSIAIVYASIKIAIGCITAGAIAG